MQSTGLFYALKGSSMFDVFTYQEGRILF